MQKLFKKIGICLSVVISAGYVSYVAPQLHLDFLRNKTENSIVRVLSPEGRGGGTGFAMKSKSGENYIVTNRHVCEVDVNGWVVINHPKYGNIFKKVVYRDSIHDLCLIAGDKRFNALSLNSSPRLGQINFIIGHPGLRNLTIAQGEYIGRGIVQLLDREVTKREQCRGEVIELNAFEQMMYRMEFACVRKYTTLSLTTVAYPGNSGSPVLDRFGRVIGVLFAGSNEQERDNHAVPAEDLRRVLNKF